MKQLAIIGAGELGQQIRHIAESVADIEFIGFFDDTRPVQNDIPWCYPLAEIEKKYNEGLFDGLVVGIGYNHSEFRKSIFEQYCDKIPFLNVVSPSAIIESTAILNRGIVIYPGVIIDKEVVIGDNVLLNLGCCIAHNCKIGHSSYISPRVAFSGFVTVGEKCFVGTNSTFVDGVTVTDNVFLGAASLVLKDIVEPGKYVGNKLRKIDNMMSKLVNGRG